MLGGSLGAQVFNELVPEVIIGLPGHIHVEVWHQTGIKHYAATTALYHSHHLSSERVMPYIDDMASAYAWADIVMCRSGGSARTAAVGMPKAGGALGPGPDARILLTD